MAHRMHRSRMVARQHGRLCAERLHVGAIFMGLDAEALDHGYTYADPPTWLEFTTGFLEGY